MPQVKKLSFTFHYQDDIPMPTGIGIHPCIDQLRDEVLLFLSSAIIRTLTQRHGLEQSLKMVEDAGYGKIGDVIKFNIKTCDRQEMVDLYGDVPECCGDDEDEDEEDEYNDA